MSTTTKQGEEAKLAVQEPRVPVALRAETMDDVWRQARLLAPSSLIPKHLKGTSDAQTLANVALVMAHGQELGLPPTQSLSGIAVVNGRPFVESRTLGALVRASGHCLYLRCTETTDKTCTWETHRRGEPSPDRRTYTWVMATTAGNHTKDTYKQHPAKMLSARALGWLLNDVYPDVTKGVGTEAERQDAVEAQASAIESAPGAEGLKARLRARGQGPERIPAWANGGAPFPPPALNADTTVTQHLESTPEAEKVAVNDEPTDEQWAAIQATKGKTS